MIRFPANASILTVMIALASLLPGSAARAEGTEHSATHSSMKEERAKLKAACESDAKTLCADVTPGEGRVASCLDSKENQLSPQCKTVWTDTKTKISKAMDKANVNFRKNCSTDAQKFCADVPSGRGRILDCLTQHEQSLSSSCTNFLSEIEKKLNQMMG